MTAAIQDLTEFYQNTISFRDLLYDVDRSLKRCQKENSSSPFQEQFGSFIDILATIRRRSSHEFLLSEVTEVSSWLCTIKNAPINRESIKKCEEYIVYFNKLLSYFNTLAFSSDKLFNFDGFMTE